MQQYRCQKCKQWISETDTEAKTEDVISYDKDGRFIGATRVKTCGICAKKDKSAVIQTVDKKPVRKDQKRLF
jgi:Pyruvate/2-oxoacid:ferredoxin oxidoreductase delta subunit